MKKNNIIQHKIQVYNMFQSIIIYRYIKENEIYHLINYYKLFCNVTQLNRVMIL